MEVETQMLQRVVPLILQNEIVQGELRKIEEILDVEELISIIIDALKEAKEKIAVKKYSEGKLTLAQLKEILGVSEWEIDEILKKHGVFRRYEI